MTEFDHELHIHLFGCLTAEDVWTLGRDRWHQRQELLTWYEDEYEKAWGRRPRSSEYWTNGDKGYDALRKDFLFTEHSPFHRFQACFNLMIALFKIRPGEHFVFERILSQHLASGLRYAEYRTVMPTTFSHAELDEYFTTQTQQVLNTERTSGGRFVPRIAYSLQRDQTICTPQYTALKQWRQANPKLAHAIVGIDFSYFETGHPPIEKKAFFQIVRSDNAANPDLALAILYHVGESFDHLSIESAARWVWEANEYGAHRLGHGIAVGIDPASRLGTVVYEDLHERLQHLRWLKTNAGWLKNRGYDVDLANIAREHKELSALGTSQTTVPMAVTTDNIGNIRAFQKALLADLSAKGAIFESCPTSNFRIGSIQNPDHHPLKSFLAHNCRVCISTDDPGIFDISLASEIELCRTQLGIDDLNLARLASALPGLRARDVSV
jgi:adenosine deaminase